MRLLRCALLVLAACHDKLPRESYPDAAPGSCGGTAPPCAADEYCAYPNDNCGYLSTGRCQPRPTSCEPGGPPVCACGFEIYPSACEALKAGKPLDARFTCDVPDGKFACGYELCDLATQYCSTGDAEDSVAVCLDAPAACTDGVTCECLAAQPCGEACRMLDGHPVVVCR